MPARILLAVLLPAVVLGGCAADRTDPILRDEWATVRNLRSAGGNWAVGEEGSAHAFYLLAKLFILKGSQADFDRLLKEHSPVARSLGLVCLTRRQGPAAVPILKAHLGDCESFHIYPRDNHGQSTTVGGVARALLGNRDYLFPESYHISRPLLPRHELFAVDLTLLADNAAIELHEALADKCTEFLTAQLAVPRLKHLRSICSDMPASQIIKAMARTEYRAEKFWFLVAALAEEELDPDSLLAVGSALTQPIGKPLTGSWRPHHRMMQSPASQPDVEDTVPPEVEEQDNLVGILYRCRRRFNAAAPGDWGDRFLATARRRQERQELILAINRTLYPHQEERPEKEPSLWDDQEDQAKPEAEPKLVVRFKTVEDGEAAGPGLFGSFGGSDEICDLTDRQVDLLVGDSDPSHIEGPSLVVREYYHFDHQTQRRAGESLVKMSARLDEVAQPWNLYGDVPYRLAEIARELHPQPGLFRTREPKVLSPAQCEAIMANVRAHLKARGRPYEMLHLVPLYRY